MFVMYRRLGVGSVKQMLERIAKSFHWLVKTQSFFLLLLLMVMMLESSLSGGAV